MGRSGSNRLEHAVQCGTRAAHTRVRRFVRAPQFDVSGAAAPLQLGERVLLQPYYSDATMLLHRTAHGVRLHGEEWRVEQDLDLTQSIGALH